MKTFITNIFHSLLSMFAIAFPYIVTQHYSWLNFTVGMALNALYLYAVKKQAVSGALKRAGYIQR